MRIIDGKQFKEMVITGATVLHNNHPEIDALNVFPVPDGDTGTNMSLTFSSGADEIEKLDSNDIYEISKNYLKVYWWEQGETLVLFYHRSLEVFLWLLRENLKWML